MKELRLDKWVIMTIFVLSASFNVYAQSCIDRQDVTLKRCYASCDYKISESQQDYDNSSIGTMNRSFNSSMNSAINELQRRGALSEYDVESYNNALGAINEGAYSLSLSNCQESCDEKYYENVDKLCY